MGVGRHKQERKKPRWCMGVNLSALTALLFLLFTVVEIRPQAR